jgi:hypothetical protein
MSLAKNSAMIYDRSTLNADRKRRMEPHSPQTTTFVSLGHRCETAWQIRRFYGQEQAYPFDCSSSKRE